MIKKHRLFLFLLISSLVGRVGGVSAAQPGFGDNRFSITLRGEYSYNTTWGHHGNFDLMAYMPLNPYFEIEAKTQFSTAKVFTGALQLRPKFELPAGEMFLETDVLYRAVARNRVSDITAALAVGYRMDYVSITLGMYARVLDDWDRSWYNDENRIVEPFNLLYRFEVFCRPQYNLWNLYFQFSNVDDFQMERMWQPLFGIGAWYDVTNRLRLNFSAQCKPVGMFHLDATFYGATLRAGVTYKF